MNQKYFIKATLNGGVSGYDESFIYHEGENVHPNPDYVSKEACGRGVHLARTIEWARDYVVNPREFYLATVTGKIIASDKTKIRVDKCHLTRIPDSSIEAYDEAIAPARKAYDEAVATARKAYDEAAATAWKVYNEAIATAGKVYNEAIATAGKAYDESTATARKAYDEAVATARKAYDEAEATSWKALVKQVLKRKNK